MKEYTSEPGTFRPNTLLYALGIFIIAAAALYFYGKYHQAPTPGADEPVIIPGLVRPGNPDFEYYLRKVSLTGVRATLGTNFAKNRIAIISGIINNDGDRKLEALEIHVSLYDVYNKLSKERTATPLRPGIGIKRAMDPLEKREFTIWIEPIEQLWNPRRVEVEITGLKYK